MPLREIEEPAENTMPCGCHLNISWKPWGEGWRTQYLNRPLDAVVHPVSESARQVTDEHQTAANEAQVVTEKELTAQEWFERGYVFATQAKNFEEAIRCFSEGGSVSSRMVSEPTTTAHRPQRQQRPAGRTGGL